MNDDLSDKVRGLGSETWKGCNLVGNQKDTLENTRAYFFEDRIANAATGRSRCKAVEETERSVG